MTRFFWIPMWKAPFFWHTYFSLREFSRLLVLLVFNIQWIDCDICLTTSNKWVQKSKGSIWIGQHFRRWGRFWNAGSHTRTTITPVTPPPPPPPPPYHPRVIGCFTGVFFVLFFQERLTWNFNIVFLKSDSQSAIRQHQRMLLSVLTSCACWAFSGSLFGLGR